MQLYSTIVIGGGAAGLMAAGRAAERGAGVLLLEKMAQTGRKIGISGKGRCNLSNTAQLSDFINEFGRNGRFLRQALEQFSSGDLISFLKDRRLEVVVERGGRIFPKSGHALEVVHLFNRWLAELQVQIEKDCPARSLIINNSKICGVRCGEKEFPCSSAILATGGKSYPRTGSTGDGYALAAEAGHTITPLRPGLVPLVANIRNNKSLAGLTLRNVKVRLYINSKRSGTEFGEMSFTQDGVSGPIILTLSGTIVDALAEKKDVTIMVDLKPALDERKLHARLLRDFTNRRAEPIHSVLRGLLPGKLVELCIDSCDLEKDMLAREISAKTRTKLVQWLKGFTFDITGHRSWDEAIITAGGVNLAEINPRTMESRLIPGLYIVGELLDISANTGGYNLQAAFSTGWLAGSSVAL